MSGEQKVALWKDKLQYILNCPELTSDEKQELETMFTYLEPRHYDTKKGLKEIQQYAELCENKLRSEYGWSDEKLYLYTYTWLTKEELDKAILQESLSSLRISTRNETVPDCECRTDSDCQYSPGLGICNDNRNCEIVREKCGFMKVWPCMGMCE